MSDLRLLPAEVRSHLRSGVAISSVSQCAEELVLNAIDAKATCVAVRIDTSICRVQVVDSGHGIDKVQLGNVASRYATSKCHSVRDMEQLRFHGYRGEALASIRNLCAILEIESCARGTGMTYRRAFQGDESSIIEESKRPRACVGTTVTVHNLFHNMPVRRKHLDESLEFEKVKRMLEGIALFNPKISISLRNELSGKLALKTQKCDSIQGTFTSLFGLDKSRHLVDVAVEQKPFKFKGYISTEAHSNKQLQYIYINGRLVLKSRIHKVVSWILQKRSVICRRKGVAKQIVGRDFSPNSSPPKQPERHGVYVLNLECPLNEYDITFDPRKTLVEFKDWTGVLKLLKDLVYNFLRQNNLLAQEDNYKGNSDRCTFADPVLQELLDDESQKFQTSGKDASPSICDQLISTENTTGNLQSKIIKRASCTKTLDSEVHSAEVHDDDDNIASVDTVINSNDRGSKEHSQLKDSYEGTPESDVPGAQLAAASRGSLKSMLKSKVQSTTKTYQATEKDEEVHFTDPPSLNTMLATDSCGKESQLPSQSSDVEISMVKMSRTRFINEAPTQAQLFAGDSSESTDRSQIPEKCDEKFTSSSNSSKKNNQQVVGVSEADTATNRVFISLPAHHSRMNSLEWFREEIKRNSAPASKVHTSVTKNSKLSGLQKIKAKMMASSHNSTQSSGMGKTANELNRQEATTSAENFGATRRQSRSHSTNEAQQQVSKKSDANFSITKLRRLAEKMKGQCHSGPQKTQGTIDAPSQSYMMTGNIHQSDSIATAPGTTGSEKPDTIKYSLINCRKRSMENLNVNCDEDIPCKSTKTKSCDNLVKSCDQSTTRAESCDIVDSRPGKVFVPERTFLTTESFLQSIHDIKGMEASQMNMDVDAVDQCADTDGLKIASDQVEAEENVNVAAEKVNDVKKFNFIGQHVTEKANKHASINKEIDLPLPTQDELQKDQFQAKGQHENITESVSREIERTSSVCTAVAIHFQAEITQRDLSNKVKEVAHVSCGKTMHDGEQATLIQKTVQVSHDNSSNSHSTQISREMVTAPFQPTVSGDFCLEFSPLKFDSSTENKRKESEDGKTLENPIDYSIGSVGSCNSEHCMLPCSQCFTTVCTESEEFDLDLLTSTQPFVPTLGSTNNSLKVAETQSSSSYGHDTRSATPVTSDTKVSNVNIKKDLQSDLSEEVSFKRPLGGGRQNESSQVEISTEDVTTKPDSTVEKSVIDSTENDSSKLGVSDKRDTPEQELISEKKSTIQPAATSDDKITLGVKETSDGVAPKVIFTSGSWICQLDPNTGGKVYVNKITGQTSTLKPGLPAACTDPIQAKVRRHGACDDAILSGWEASNAQDGKSVRAPQGSPSSVPSDSSTYTSFKQWENPMFKQPSDAPCYAVSDRTQVTKQDVKVQTLIQPQRFTKQMLQTAKVLKQVDDKFILCVMKPDPDTASVTQKNSDVLVVIDQHAAHERVRLEQLTASLCRVDTLLEKSAMEDTLIEKSDINPPLEVILSSDLARIIKAFKTYITVTGIEFGEDRDDVTKIFVSQVPACLISKEVAQMKKNKTRAMTQLVQEYLVEQAELLKITSGSVASLPPTLHNILCSQACHGAIKFGDPLTLTECKKLVASLSGCSLPFQCAHGRPSCMPLLHLNSLKTSDQRQTTEPKIRKLCERIRKECKAE